MKHNLINLKPIHRINNKKNNCQNKIMSIRSISKKIFSNNNKRMIKQKKILKINMHKLNYYRNNVLTH